MASPSFTTRPELAGTFGMIATTHWLGSAVGMAVLEGGGNAFDAAVAAGFMLQVCEPHLCGPGGDLPAILHSVSENATRVLCAQGVAPAAATIAHFRSLGLDMVPGNGLLPSVVPGAFDGWMRLLRDYGSLTVEEVLAPAIGYLENGCPLLAEARASIEQLAGFFETNWPSSAGQWNPYRSSAGPSGRLYRNQTLANTYRRISDAAKRATSREAGIDAAREIWSTGFVAAAIDSFCRSCAAMDSSGAGHTGLLTAADLAGWSASFEEPLTLDWKGYSVCKAGFWSQSPVLLQQLAILRNFPIAELGPGSADFVHLLVETSKLAFADRDGFYDDPKFGTQDLRGLLSESYAAERRQRISARASLETIPGTLNGRPGWIDRGAVARAKSDSDMFRRLGLGEPTVKTKSPASGDTVHIDVVDRWGNMISATPSGGWLQSSPFIPDLGFCLNTRGQMFMLDENCPAALQPGKRPRTTLSPTLVLREGKPYLAFGTPGGDHQDQWSLQFFLRHFEHGLNLQEAIDSPSFSSEHAPSSFWPKQAYPGRLVLEGRFPRAIVEDLAARGHDVTVGPEWSLARLCAVSKEGNLLKAGANPRNMQAYAIGR